jgi:hypothetical protein
MSDKANPRKLSLIVNDYTGEVNAIAASVLSMAAAWLAPLPEATMTARAIAQVFNLSMLWSAVVAASIELVGIRINAYYLDAVEFNASESAYNTQHGRKTDRVALEDTRGAVWMVYGFYGVTFLIVMFTAIYNAVTTNDPLKLLAILFPVMSSFGTISANRAASLHRKVAELAQPNKPLDVSGPPVDTIIKPVDTIGQKDMPLKSIDLNQWRALVASMNGNRPKTSTELNQWLATNGYEQKPVTTARRWADMKGA